MSGNGELDISDSDVAVKPAGGHGTGDSVSTHDTVESGSESLRRSGREAKLSLKAKENKALALRIRIIRAWTELGEENYQTA